MQVSRGRASILGTDVYQVRESGRWPLMRITRTCCLLAHTLQACTSFREPLRLCHQLSNSSFSQVEGAKKNYTSLRLLFVYHLSSLHHLALTCAHTGVYI